MPPPSGPPYRYFVTVILDGFETLAEQTVVNAVFALYARLPVTYCLLTLLFLPEEVRKFKNTQNLKGRIGPLILITEKNPFLEEEVRPRALIELGHLRDPDDIKKIMALIAEQAHDEDFLKRAKTGELLRRLREGIGRYGELIANTLSIVGL